MEPSRAAPAASSGVSEVEMDATRGGRHQQEERQQYISKVPSSSFLRMLPERVDKLSAADALVAVPVPEQQRLVERFIEYAEQVRGPQLHLLREHDGSDLAKAFLQQVKELQEPFVAADTEADLPANAAGSDSSSASGAVLSNAKEAHLGSSSTVLFRLVEGAISLSPSAVHAPLSGRGFRGLCAAADSDQHGSSTMSTNGEGEDDEVVFAGQLESFLQLAENEIATKELTGWGMEAEGSAAAVKLRSRRVLLAGALVPMALDDTLVLEHKVTLRRGAYQRASSTKKLDACETGGLEATMAASTDAAADVERLRDVLHMHAYEGRLRVILPDDLKVQRGGRRGSWSQSLDASVVVLARADEPRCLSIFYHFREGASSTPSYPSSAGMRLRLSGLPDCACVCETSVLFLRFLRGLFLRSHVEGSYIIESEEWKQLQKALAPLLASREIAAFRGLIHTRREQTGLCYGPPVGLDMPAFTPLRAPRDTCDWAAQLDGSAVVQSDAKLQEFVPQLRQRFQTLGEVLSSLKEQMGGLEAFASGHKVFGFQRIKSGGLCGWEYREWLPNAKAVYLFGDFNGWKRTSHPLNRERRAVAPHFFEASFGALKGAKDAQPQSETSDELSSVWSIFLPDNPDGTPALFHRLCNLCFSECSCRMRVLVVPYEGEPIDRVPAWAPVVWRSEDSGLFNAVLWNPPEDVRLSCFAAFSSALSTPFTISLTHKERHVFRHSRPSFAPGVSPSVYEAHIGSSSGEEGRIGSFVEFTTSVLPRIKSLGYNTLLYLYLIGSTMPSGVSSRLGTVEEFKALVDRAHALGLRVLISLCHAYSSKNVMDGLGCMDGGDNNYFISGPSGVVENARVFDFSKTEVTRFLLSNISYWLTEFLYVDHPLLGGICVSTFTFASATARLDFVRVFLKLDGFRMEGVTWMLYEQRSALRQPDPYDYSTYFTKDLCAAGVLYLSLANSLLSALLPPERRLSIAQECTGYPTLCRPLSQGGLGFDFRLDSSWSQSIRRLIRQSGHRQGRWMTAPFVWAIASKPNTEKLLVSVDDADTTRVCRRRLRIALFAWESLHTHAVGGVAPHVTELAAALSRQGHDVHVFVRATELCGGCSVHYGVAYHECTFDLNRDFVIEIQNMCESFIACMQSVEESMGAEFQICHAHDWLAGKALVKAKQMGRTSILTMHSTEFGRCGNNNYGGVSKRIRDIEGGVMACGWRDGWWCGGGEWHTLAIKGLCSFWNVVEVPCASELYAAEACHMADRVICVSGVLAEEVRAQYGVHPAKMTVVYNGINCNKFDGEVDSGAVKHMYGVGVLDPMFLFVGRMVVQKGPDLLLEAVPFIHKFRGDAKFVFVGDGHMLDSLKGRAAQLGVTHAVRFVGKMGGGALHALFKSCDAVVVPSRNEPFGIVVLEAWSAAKPVVATNSGGPRDFVNPNITGILVDPTPGSIAWGCCEILKNFEHARWMGSRGRVTAAFSFSWDSIAHQTREIYYEQRNRHDAPPNWTYSSEGDETLAFAIIGPAMFKHMSVEDSEPRVASGLALWRLYLLLGSGLADGCMTFMANEFAHPDCLDLPRPANHFSMAKAFRRWNLAESATLKFTQCEVRDTATRGHGRSPTLRYSKNPLDGGYFDMCAPSECVSNRLSVRLHTSVECDCSSKRGRSWQRSWLQCLMGIVLFVSAPASAHMLNLQCDLKVIWRLSYACDLLQLFDCCLNHWESVFSWQSASHLYVVKCDEEAQVVVLERGPCLFAFNFHPHASYEGFQVGCMYSEPMRLFLDSDEARFGGFGRLTPRTQHPATEARDSRPHSVKIYLPSSTCAVYVRESIYEEKRGIIMATPDNRNAEMAHSASKLKCEKEERQLVTAADVEHTTDLLSGPFYPSQL
ncbi:lps glycosyltransferase of possible cyanobacterial [Cyclospora cayetanensis]|uniref:Lps glycosyltransferase of possible cyanobacterial n=1 Tax=Cyclospora cayetanensis TaxID=88456 RepID=A0A1D3D9P4_9EIME|nr:lps glycosyltransferase of possible cyanobacterial [Cyclospora cayetanensis]